MEMFDAGHAAAHDLIHAGRLWTQQAQADRIFAASRPRPNL